ncbi:MAG: hypothetical protein ACD_47C00225G0006 [uncultured bacterium]|uniref:Uncharacterized protein n=1 Tax=Candidatus Wallbacteria bacterium GWC2_49_35 TaxID=1817813 RepID=A0A1F7WLJ5_9BACT|nr:MAG: hypothetical protein ACD_47C00225G0006 [uncultured bacterium]OGM03712.1 MAG: hypothetical protein A2008_08645 [Candidatus Wallbacteria bacterium GWC2_49_35]HBC75638.1 hypothetical protein [Candidatus Wallbacteria bacterium]
MNKHIESLIKTAVAEIEEPLQARGFIDGLKKLLSGAGEELSGAVFELIGIRNKSAEKIASYESITSFIRANDFVVARNLIVFGLIGAAAFFSMRFCRPEDMIFALYGATAFYIFMILLTPQKIKKYRLLKACAIREYRENLISFSIVLVKKYSLDPAGFAIKLKGGHSFAELVENNGVHYFKIN